ncbi:MAG: glycosyltransferase family 61 protein, partial [Bacteroidetes bacterium]|nr:glycosyltransferase family 61 protein [Bacteroidota bacterium]
MKSNPIKTNLPVNLDVAHKHLYSDKVNYNYPELKVKRVRNSFVTHFGLAMKRGLLVRGTAPNIQGKLDKNFYYSHWRKAIEQFLVCRFGKSLESTNLSKETNYALVYAPWFGYFSWVTDSLPRIQHAIESGYPFKLICPEKWTRIKYVQESLQMFPSLDIEIIPDGTHMFVPNLLLPETRPWTFNFSPKSLDKIRQLCKDHVERNNLVVNKENKIYISRKNAKRRRFINNDDVEQLVAKLGFEIINMEDYSFFEQVALLKNAKFVIGLHGAGLTNINFMQQDSSVLELTNEVYGKWQQ